MQPVEIPLAQFAGLTPVEMLGQTEFPRIGDQPYFLTLAPYGFYWFQLQEAVVPITARTAPRRRATRAVPALFAGVVWDSMLDGSMRAHHRAAGAGAVPRSGSAGSAARRARWRRRGSSTGRRCGAAPTRRSSPSSKRSTATADASGTSLPLAMSSGAEAAAIEQQHATAVLARITGARKGLLYDGLFDDGTCLMLLAAHAGAAAICRCEHGQPRSRPTSD